jgi:hypothetical protein
VRARDLYAILTREDGIDALALWPSLVIAGACLAAKIARVRVEIASR